MQNLYIQSMAVIEKIYELNASSEEVFEALTNADIIQLWSGDEAKMDATVGGSFTLWSGQMFGKNIEIEKNKKLVQEWCYEQWKEPSKVTIQIKAKQKKLSTVTLIHEDVPEKSFTSISEGWDMYYFGAMQEMFDNKNSITPHGNFKSNAPNVL